MLQPSTEKRDPNRTIPTSGSTIFFRLRKPSTRSPAKLIVAPETNHPLRGLVVVATTWTGPTSGDVVCKERVESTVPLAPATGALNEQPNPDGNPVGHLKLRFAGFSVSDPVGVTVIVAVLELFGAIVTDDGLIETVNGLETITDVPEAVVIL